VPVVQADVNPLDPTAELEDLEAFHLREYHAVVRLTYALSGSRLAAEDIAHRWRLEAGAPARLLAGRGPAVAELPEEDAGVWRAVRALPTRQAQVVALRYVVDAPVAEIAQTLGVAEGTVKAQLHRARQTLAARLATAWEDDHA
jgi:DNA-binding NarL/FixJ family response regulator